jgi:hypothetical protein
MRTGLVAATLTVALSLQACSSKPRQFEPKLAAAPADPAAFEAAHAECRQLLADGKLDSSGRLASGGAGAVAGGATMAVGSAAAAGVGGWSGLAVASATVVALPFVMVGGAWGLAKAKKNKKERKIQEATAGCLGERGFAVAGWEKSSKKRPAAVKQASAAQRQRQMRGHSD